jgi:NTE family protein
MVTGGSGYGALVASQRLPASEGKEIVPEFDLDLLLTLFGLMTTTHDDPAAVRREIGAMALAAPTVPAETRREIIAWRIADAEWPDRRFVVTAVDVDSGERVTFDLSSGTSLVDAVTASCAVPGIWPVVTIGDHRYTDGGVYSTSNADLAAGYERTVVVTPVDRGAPAVSGGDGVAPYEIVADAASVEAFGPNLLDPSCREAALDAGMRQGENVADDVARYWAATSPSHR